MSNGKLFKSCLKNKILILDGATGTMIQRQKLCEADFRGDVFKNHVVNLSGNNEILSITNPHIIENIHRVYLEAGADIIECNTFNANSVSQKKYQTENFINDMNRSSIRLARKLAEEYTKKDLSKPRFIAGSIGPTNKSVSIQGENSLTENITYDELYESYYEQAIVMSEENVDIFLIETVFDVLNAKAAIDAVKKSQKETNTNIPIMVSATLIKDSGKILSGQTPEELYTSIESANPLVFGLNCSTGSANLVTNMQKLSNIVSCAVSVYSNAGEPDETGNYKISPDDMADEYEKLAKSGTVNICGGCCGTTPEHIKAISERLKNFAPKNINIL